MSQILVKKLAAERRNGIVRRGVENARKFAGMLSQVRTDYRIALARMLTEQWVNVVSSGERRDTRRVSRIVGWIRRKREGNQYPDNIFPKKSVDNFIKTSYTVDCK